ncbi:MAG TPA: type II secretion system F family protein [Actinospica sp.]|nr:type II secretion system F family protein [Actinospica sp.]
MTAYLGPLSWPEPGIRALETAVAITLAFCALVLRGGRWPSFPSLPRQVRGDPLAVAWTSIRVRRPNLPETVWAVLGGVAVAAFVGGSASLPAGLFGAIGSLVWQSRRRAKAGLRDRARLAAQVPPLADLFAAGLAAGLQPAQAAMTVAQAFAGDPPQSAKTRRGPADRDRVRDPVRDHDRGNLTGIPLLACRFQDAATAVLAGADPQAAWSGLAMDETTAPLAAAVIRAGRTGAPAAATVGRAARELREAAADALAAEVRTVGVKATAPLVLCFLPAFVLLGVLPTAVGLLPHLRG